MNINTACVLLTLKGTIDLQLYLQNNKKHLKKNGIVCRDIKTKKAQDQDWDDTLATKLN